MDEEVVSNTIYIGVPFTLNTERREVASPDKDLLCIGSTPGSSQSWSPSSEHTSHSVYSLNKYQALFRCPKISPQNPRVNDIT